MKQLAFPALASLCIALAQPAIAQSGGAQTGAAADVAVGERVGTQYMVFKTSTEGQAKTEFLRGLALLHNFEYARAAAAFRESQQADPDFVMAYWGEAMTYNHPLWEEQDRDAALAVLMRLDPSREGRFAKTRSQREAMWLDAVETLYGDGSKEDRDHLYLAKMRALLQADPDDIDARAFTGLAILGTSHGGRQIPIYMEAAGLLEPGFMTHPMHPGILHYLIHSYDDPTHAPLGERAAERYAKVAPDAGHAQHMVSHIYHALADWEASEAANILADAVVDRQAEASGSGPSNCGHYNEWLVYARLQLGKDVSDIVSACRVDAQQAIAAGGGQRLVNSYARIAGWNGVDTGQWAQPIEATASDYPYAMIGMAHADALKHRREANRVAVALAKMRRQASVLAQRLEQRSPDDRTTMTWVERAIAQVEAIELLAAGDASEGLSALQAAAEAESALPVVFGPPALLKPSWELLGEELLAAGRSEEAAEAFRKALEFAPGRRLSEQGLARAVGG